MLTGRTRELADLLKARSIDIACIQETKWKGAKARDIAKGTSCTIAAKCAIETE